MSNYRIIPSTLKYPSSPTLDQSIGIGLESNQNELINYDRNVSVDLEQVYTDEKQNSKIYRPTFKVMPIYDNAYFGTTEYPPLRDNLYYVNPENSIDSTIWSGYPQYYEFDFFRSSMYENHIRYVSKSAYTYNWSYAVTYAFDNDYKKSLFFSDGINTIEWISGDGIPFVMEKTTQNGTNIIRFNCFTKHNLKVGEFIKLPFSYNNTSLFSVFSLGDEQYGSEEYVFDILNIGFTGNTFFTGKVSTLKRVLNPSNESETTSKYYIKRHKILKADEDIVINKAGFDKIAFSDERKIEYDVLTPNKKERISQKNSTNNYLITVSNDIDLSDLIDNQKRPISQLYLSITHKGYSGIFNKPYNGVSLKEGWDFNVKTANNIWWENNNIKSNSNIKNSFYFINERAFYYNESPKVGDLINGDFCEWNDYEQNEFVLSRYIQKIKYNPDIFSIGSDSGFYYYPHNTIQIRVFSDYIETAPAVVDVPNWSFFSKVDNEFRWRDMYDIGFSDESGNVLDYPFLNSAHYPYDDMVFKIFADKNRLGNLDYDGITKNITTDDCE